MTQPTRTGTITLDGPKASIRFERRLPYPIETVWAALTDPAQRAEWLGKTTLDPRVGGAFSMLSEGPPVPDAMREVTGHVLAWDPPHVFEHSWSQRIIGETVARYELERVGNATILRFTHSGLRVDDARGFIPGEHAYLDRLEATIAKEELPSWQERYAEVQPAYPEDGEAA